jgi:hypothetical protein
VAKVRPPPRFRDDGRSLFDGLDDIRVKCPKCGGAGLIARIVAAPLRERRVEHGSANRSIASRLPVWVKAAKNREEVLRALARLRRRLAEAT